MVAARWGVVWGEGQVGGRVNEGGRTGNTVTKTVASSATMSEMNARLNMIHHSLRVGVHASFSPPTSPRSNSDSETALEDAAPSA